MNRVKEVEAKQKAPKINKDAAKRFVRSALWQQAQQKSHRTEMDKTGESSSVTNSAASAASAISADCNEEPATKRKR